MLLERNAANGIDPVAADLAMDFIAETGTRVIIMIVAGTGRGAARWADQGWYLVGKLNTDTRARTASTCPNQGFPTQR